MTNVPKSQGVGDNARPFDFYLTLAGDEAANAVDHFTALLIQRRQRAPRPNDLRHLKATLGRLLANLLLASERGHFVKLPLRPHDYTTGRYFPEEVTHAAMGAALQLMADTGLVELEKGKAGARWERKRPRVRPTAALRDILKTTFGLTPAHLASVPGAECVRLKGPKVDGQAVLIDYADTDHTKAMRAKVEKINHRLTATDITLNGSPVHPRTLYRTFNNGAFDQGGRFYGGGWIMLHEQERLNLRLDGEAVVEVDYVAHHPRLLHALEGCPLPLDVDPYNIPGLERSVVKLAVQCLFNSTPGQRLRLPQEALQDLPQGITSAEVFKAVKKAFAPIARHFKTGAWAKLQYLDSELAEAILLALDAQGIPCLPVHDSFIVKVSDGEALKRVMVEEYQRMVGHAPALKVTSAT